MPFLYKNLSLMKEKDILMVKSFDVEIFIDLN